MRLAPFPCPGPFISMDEIDRHNISPTATCGLVQVHQLIDLLPYIRGKALHLLGRKSSGAESVLQLVIGELGQIAAYPDHVLARNLFEVPEVYVIWPGSLDQRQRNIIFEHPFGAEKALAFGTSG